MMAPNLHYYTLNVADWSTTLQLLRGDSFTYVQELLFAPLQRERFFIKIKPSL
jgi:hypothetical protein